MARAKRGTLAGDIATEKYRKTMLERYGGAEGMREHYREIGSKGGKLSRGGGFTNNPEFARKCGKKGGSISRRVYEKYSKWDSIKEEAYNLYKLGVPMTKLAEKYDLSVSGIRLKLKKMEEHEVKK